MKERMTFGEADDIISPRCNAGTDLGWTKGAVPASGPESWTGFHFPFFSSSSSFVYLYICLYLYFLSLDCTCTLCLFARISPDKSRIF